MALLLYVVTDAETPLPPDAAGFRAAPVERHVREGLACWYSVVEREALPSFAAADAIAIHRLYAAALGTVIPFRFPTLVADEAELDRYLSENMSRFAGMMDRLRGLVQMEVHLELSEVQGHPGSGREYLLAARERDNDLRRSRDELAARTGALEVRWAEDGRRVYALVRSGSEQAFREAIAAAALPASVTVRVTGPWAPTAFLEPPRTAEVAS